MQNDTSSGKSLNDCILKLRSCLDALRKNANENNKELFKRYNADINILYDGIIKLSEKVNLPSEYISKVKRFNTERQELLEEWEKKGK